MTVSTQLSRRLCLGGLAATLPLAELSGCARPGHATVRYGITPYQDSALPVVAQRKGWYTAAGLDIRLVSLTWDQVIPALSSGAIDAAIYNFNSFLEPYENAAQRAVKPLFYAPLYIFKGQAIMVHGSQGYKTVADLGSAPDALKQIGLQLRGKKIAATRGTELEQIVLATLAAAGLTERDATIVHSSPEDALAAFLSGNIDAFAAGLTERIAAHRHGAVELVTQADVMSPVTDGLVTTDKFAASNIASLDKLLLAWFRTINYVGSDLLANSAEIRDYLRTSASSNFTPEEYKIAWSFNNFARSAAEAAAMFSAPSSPYYWKNSWDQIDQFLMREGKIRGPVPYSAYSGDEVLSRLTRAAAA